MIRKTTPSSSAWSYLHCPITLAALEANKHVMTEARMAMNAEEAQTMLLASQAAPSLVTQIVPPPFTLKADRTIRRLISEGYLGDVLVIDIRYQMGFLNPDTPITW